VFLKEVVSCGERRKDVEEGVLAAFACPRKSRRRKYIKSEVEGFDGGVVRRIVYEFTVTEQKRPAPKTTSSKICEFRRLSSLCTLLRKMRFWYILTDLNTAITANQATKVTIS
jgi:hypothetical protein